MLLIESEMPVSKVSDCVGVTAPRVWRVFDYWIQNNSDVASLLGVENQKLTRHCHENEHSKKRYNINDGL